MKLLPAKIRPVRPLRDLGDQPASSLLSGGGTDNPKLRRGARPASRADADSACIVLVAVSGSAHASITIAAAARLASSLGAAVEAVHIETPGGDDPDLKVKLADALSEAQEFGASVVKLPASTVANGLAEHLRITGATHVVLGSRSPQVILGLRRRSIADELLRSGASAELLVVPDPSRGSRALMGKGNGRSRWVDYVVAGAAVAVTVLLAWLLRQTTSVISTSILFLFPVIAVAARRPLGATLFAVAASVVSHNLVFVRPFFSFDFVAAQSWIMTAVLLVVGIYTSMLTSSLRGRVKLSDRSARESASLAAFAQRLTRIADWTGTGAAVCEEVSMLMEVETVIFREIEGKLVKVADHPAGVELDSLDQMALEWAWQHGETCGIGTSALQAVNWQFHPLTTSLGVLAVIGLARPDGRPPVAPHQSVLLSTLLAQASLAHERLRLEDQMRCP